jgi:hypothetical protein
MKKKLGLLKLQFPTYAPFTQFASLQEWKMLNVQFLFASKEALNIPVNESEYLKGEAEDILAGRFVFFNSLIYNIGKDYDWLTNPETGYKYDINKHWSEVNDYSPVAGDIKYVWEKSRFGYLYTLMRYDYHFKKDQSAFIFKEVIDWIDKNPVNRGPNYRCSQEMTLRVLNWTFAINYYKNSSSLTEEIFGKVMNAVYWHMKHVYDNIDFSRIAVRNNHAITETLGLYLVGMLYPFFPDAKKWKEAGRKWLEEEVQYQIYEDGTFLQFSMNYNRVVVQLLTWALRLNELNDTPFAKDVYDRAEKTLTFLYSCMDPQSGKLPNYGANDGALFMKFGNAEFRDYRPQLEALAASLGMQWDLQQGEDKYWYGLDSYKGNSRIQSKTSFPIGGFYLLKDADSLSFLRCGKHKDRPQQADNLHLDIWYKGQNILRDAGSFKYNADTELIRYFFGTASHNTVMLNDYDQMQKGGRFIWYHWTQAESARIEETNEYFLFNGTIHAFQHVANGIKHTRVVKKYKSAPRWDVIDTIVHSTGEPMHQVWNPAPLFHADFSIKAKDANGAEIALHKRKGWYSETYGVKEESEQLVFSTQGKTIVTTIELK